MVQENELRVGSFVYLQEDDDDWRVFKVKSCLDMCSYERMEPIPLSPDILQACGFEYSQEHINGFEKEDRYSIYIDEDEEYAVCFVTSSYGGVEEKHIRLRKLWDTIYYLPNFTSLHHLQNAIWLFTGQELTINLEQVTP